MTSWLAINFIGRCCNASVLPAYSSGRRTLEMVGNAMWARRAPNLESFQLALRCRANEIAALTFSSLECRASEKVQPVCLRCGRTDCDGVTDSVRAAGMCSGSYACADLALVRCFICGEKGHLCCAVPPAITYRCDLLSISALKLFCRCSGCGCTADMHSNTHSREWL